MRIELKYRKVCDRCEGNENLEGYPEPDCKTCNGKGYVDEVMEMKWMGHIYNYRPTDEGEIKSYNLGFEPDGSLFICTFDKDGKYIANVSDSLNPQSLHIIEEKECPLCQQHPIQMEVGLNHFSKNRIEKAHNCTDGKIEIETSFTVFGKSQEEYEAEKYEKGIEEGMSEGAEQAMSDITRIIDGDTPMDMSREDLLDSIIGNIETYIEQNTKVELNSEQETNGS